MRLAKGIKTVRKVDTTTQVFNDYGKLVNPVNLYVVTELKKWANGTGFTVSFRTYSETFENGGFETTLSIKGIEANELDSFLTTVSKAKVIASQMGGELTTYSTNNRIK